MPQKIKNKIPCDIIVTESNDNRSYRQNSSKLEKTGFTANYGIDHAIEEIIDKYRKGILSDKDEFYTIKTMKKTLNL